MENVTRNTHFIHCKGLHGKLHTVKGSRFPNVIRGEIVCAFCRHGLVFTLCTQFNSHLIRLVVRNLDDISHSFPFGAQFTSVLQAHFITNGQFDIPELELRKDKTRQVFVVET